MQIISGIAHTLFNPATLIGAIFAALVIFIFAWIISQIIHRLVSRALRRASGGSRATAILFLEQLAKVIVYILAVMWYTHLVPSLHSLSTAWLASVGVISIVVGLATQSTLSNLVAGVSLVLYRPFKVGDQIQISSPIGPEIGVVQKVDLGYTMILTADKRRVVIPNGVIASQPTINLSRSLPHIPCDVTLMIASDSDVEQAQKILFAIAASISKIGKVNGCFITDIKSQTVTLTLSALCIDPADVNQIKSDILLQAKKQLADAKIKIAG